MKGNSLFIVEFLKLTVLDLTNLSHLEAGSIVEIINIVKDFKGPIQINLLKIILGNLTSVF